jgi:hypothetical protein
MKLLLENWRQYLLTEAAMTTEDLMSNPDLYISISPSNENSINVWYANADGTIRNPRPSGYIEIMLPDEFLDVGPCDGSYMVVGSRATDKWGPLLYDVAMEWATLNGNGLIADRDMISDKARAVWDYYLGQRGDVDNHQLDDLKNTLTPIEVDNCDQYIASVGGKYDWEENSLSKRYTKAPTTITELEKLGRFIDET